MRIAAHQGQSVSKRTAPKQATPNTASATEMSAQTLARSLTDWRIRRMAQHVCSPLSLSSKSLLCQNAEVVANTKRVLIQVSTLAQIPLPQRRAQLVRQKVLDRFDNSRRIVALRNPKPVPRIKKPENRQLSGRTTSGNCGCSLTVLLKSGVAEGHALSVPERSELTECRRNLASVGHPMRYRPCRVESSATI